jgi:small multidrug resistance pump
MLLRILTGAYVALTASALIIVKLSSRSGSFIELVNGRPHLNINLLTITGIFLYGASFLLYIYLISKFDLGYIIPLTTALIYILIFAASFTIFKETFTAMKVAGIVLIVIGLIFLNWKK